MIVFVIQLTAWCRVLLEELPGSQVVKFPALCGTPNFITTLTRATSWRSVLILSSLFKVILFPQASLPKPHMNFFPPPISATCPPHLILLYFITEIIFGEECRSWSSSLCALLHSTVLLSLLGPKSLSAPCSAILRVYVPPSMWATKFHSHTTQQAKLLVLYVLIFIQGIS